jgi:dipeptidyl aminopeptidase/acylaminoacyl peptidase
MGHLKSEQLTNLTTLNADKQNIALGKIEPLTIKTKDDVTAEGFLLYPVDYQPGKLYPLIIATYGFHGKRYALNAEEWHSSFPAQIFAKEGYFVLLLSLPPDGSQAMVNDSEKARERCGWQKLHVFEQAVTTLVDKKLVDANKVGLYGWSHGAFVVEFLITHSNKFQVASIGEGGDYNPGGFWLGGMPIWSKIFDNTFGGPPWGETLKNYLAFSPFFNVEKIKTPLLMEFSTCTVSGLEMYTPLRYLNIPAELVIYDGEEHNFVKPKARMASMKRKVDWFNYWFFDKRDSSNPEQYSRWDEMRAAFKKHTEETNLLPQQ